MEAQRGGPEDSNEHLLTLRFASYYVPAEVML